MQIVLNGIGLKMSEKLIRAWSACPNCMRDLGCSPIGFRPPYQVCPYCGIRLVPTLWQRLVWTLVATILTFAAPMACGFTGFWILFTAPIFVFPALVAAYILVFKLIPPRYAVRYEPVTTLFLKKRDHPNP